MTEAERLAQLVESRSGCSDETKQAAALLRSQAAEIERLKAEIDNIKQVEFPRRLRNVTKPLIAERDALRAELEAIKKQEPVMVIGENESLMCRTLPLGTKLYAHPAPKQDHTALLQQALEALENGKRVRNGEGGTKYQPTIEDAAIAAIKEVLK